MKVDSAISADFGGVALNDSLLWIGLAAGPSDYGGSLGGIYRIERRTGAWRYIVDSTLAATTVTGLGQARDWLFIGTKHLGDDGYFGSAGLLRMSLRDGRLSAMTPANSPLPDALINCVAADDDIVAIAMEKGLAVIELRAAAPERVIERWNVAYFSPGFAGDSLVFRLGSRADAAGAADKARYTFAQMFAPRGRVLALFRALRDVPAPMMDSALRDAPSRTPGLAHPAFWSALEAMLSIPAGSAQARAAEAITELGPRTPALLRAATREGFAMFDTLQARTGTGYLHRRVLAGALRSFGDTTPLGWAHSRLSRATAGVANLTADDRVALWAAIGIVADARDTVGLRQLETLSGADRGFDKDIFSAYALYDSPRAWRSAIDLFERRHPEPQDPYYYARALIGQATPTAMTDTTLRRNVIAIIGEWMRSEHAGNRTAAVEAVLRLRIGSFSPALVGLLSDTAGVGGTAYAALVNLHGRADAPVFRERVSDAAIGWWKSLMAKGALPVVSRDEGERAIAEWRRKAAGR